MNRILIVGAGGQIGSELTTYLRGIYGDANVVATDMRDCRALGEAGPFEADIELAVAHGYKLRLFGLRCRAAHSPRQGHDAGSNHSKNISHDI